MQKVLQRVQRAERHAKKQGAKRVELREKEEARERRIQYKMLRGDQTDRLKQAKVNMKIDWAAGPLAPRRDVGDQTDIYGSIYSRFLHPPPRHESVLPKDHWIRTGDRVVIIKGREKGKIGIVDEKDKNSFMVSVRDMNQIDVHIPDWIRQEQQFEKSVIQQTQKIPLEDVRLVYPLPDPVTGVMRDVVIERTVRLNGDKGPRAIPGTNIIIPWPEQAERSVKEYDADTTPEMVSKPTFKPTLITPPMPLSVIDELRNKYSKFRKRVDYEHRLKLEEREATEERRKKLIDTMKTPKQEYAELKQQQKLAQEKELTDEQLARIGEIMAQERARSTQTLQQ